MDSGNGPSARVAQKLGQLDATSTVTRLKALSSRGKYKPLLVFLLISFLFTLSAGAILENAGNNDAVFAPQRAESRSRKTHFKAESDYGGSDGDMAFMNVKDSMMEASSELMGADFQSQLDQSMQELKTPTQLEQLLVHTGQMEVQILEDQKVTFQEHLDGLIQKGEGYCQNQRQYDQGYGYYSMQMTIRLRSDRFHQTMEEIKAIVQSVSSWSTNTHDVTEDYVDATARADVLEASRTSLQTLLSKAGTVDEILHLQRELNRLTEQVESHRQRAKHLQNQASYSTLTLEVQVFNPSQQGSRKWSPWTVVVRAADDVIHAFRDVVDIVLYLAVWCLPLVLVLFCWACWPARNEVTDRNHAV